MAVLNKVTDPDYIQWIEYFVCKVLEHADIRFENVVIDDIEFDKRIFIIVDGDEYDIRTWNFKPIAQDCYGKTCCENVSYTLLKMVEDSTGAHGEDVSEGNLEIQWEN